MKIAHKDDHNVILKMCEGASSSITGASVRIMTSAYHQEWDHNGKKGLQSDDIIIPV